MMTLLVAITIAAPVATVPTRPRSRVRRALIKLQPLVTPVTGWSWVDAACKVFFKIALSNFLRFLTNNIFLFSTFTCIFVHNVCCAYDRFLTILNPSSGPFVPCAPSVYCTTLNNMWAPSGVHSANTHFKATPTLAKHVRRVRIRMQVLAREEAVARHVQPVA